MASGEKEKGEDFTTEATEGAERGRRVWSDSASLRVNDWRVAGRWRANILTQRTQRAAEGAENGREPGSIPSLEPA